MLREELYSRLIKKFGVTEGYKNYSKIINLLEYTYQNINRCGFSTEFYNKIFEILE